MTTTTANVAPKISELFSGCFKRAMDKKKKISEGGAEPAPAAGNVVATSSNLTKGDFNGSMEQTREQVKNALIADGRYGKYPYIIATYDDHVFVESDSPSPQPTRFFTVPYKIENGEVKLSEPTEVEKITKFIVKEIAESVLKDLLYEGGAGSGNWGHKGRPGHMGGSLPGGGKGKSSGGTGKSGGVATPKKGQKTGKGSAGISPHIVGTKGGEKVHASTFYDKSGGLNRAQYSKLSPNQKASVLSHGVSKYKEKYVPKAGQGAMNDAQKAQNRKVGEYEGIRRATLQRASKTSKGSGEWRALMHIAIQMQQKIAQQKGNVQAGGSKVASAAFGAIRSSAQQPGRGGR